MLPRLGWSFVFSTFPGRSHDITQTAIPNDQFAFSQSRAADYAFKNRQALRQWNGFFFAFGEKHFLVTNWHIVSGKNWQTKELIHESAAVPRKIQVDFWVDKAGNALVQGTKQLDCDDSQFTIELYNDQDCPIWIEHPTLGSDCDVVAINIDEKYQELSAMGLQLSAIDLSSDIVYELNPSVMGTVFITGFPLSKEVSFTGFPIYKRGDIASEPDVMNDGGKFYVDSKTKPGMSGSPVLLEGYVIDRLGDGKLECFFNFVGIYSGRMPGTDEYEAELGIVWRYDFYLLPILGE